MIDIMHHWLARTRAPYAVRASLDGKRFGVEGQSKGAIGMSLWVMDWATEVEASLVCARLNNGWRPA